MNAPSAKQVTAAVQTVAAIAEAIRGLGEVPNGELYANVCGTLDLQQYEQVIALLKRADLVSESAHVLKWVGPKF
jgi:hypothetical protein